MRPPAYWGSTCPECSFAWSISLADAREIVSSAPASYRAALAGGDARRKPAPRPEGVWSASGYAWHVADVLRVWAERLWAVRHDPATPIAGFDQDDLARVRGYDRMSAAGALWALERGAGDWDAALDGLGPKYRFQHPDFGPITVSDIVRHIAHEVHHHELDVRRGLGIACA